MKLNVECSLVGNVKKASTLTANEPNFCRLIDTYVIAFRLKTGKRQDVNSEPQ